MAKTFVSMIELSDYLGLPVGWLKEEVEAGRIPHIRVNRRRMFNVAIVEQMLLESTTKGATGTADAS